MDSKDQDTIDLILHILQEHEEKFDKIETRLDEIRKIIEHYSPIINELKETKTQKSDVRQSILVVDDDPNVVKTYKMVLEGSGYSVETATSAMEAIRKTRRIHFDLVIVDMNLPDTLGDELSERLSAINKNLRIIMITGYSNYKEKLDNELKNVEVLMKPINPEQLVEVTMKTLQKR